MAFERGPFNLNISTTLPNYQTFSISPPSPPTNNPPPFKQRCGNNFDWNMLCVYVWLQKLKDIFIPILLRTSISLTPHHQRHRMTASSQRVYYKYICTTIFISSLSLFLALFAISRRIPGAILYFRARCSLGKWRWFLFSGRERESAIA